MIGGTPPGALPLPYRNLSPTGGVGPLGALRPFSLPLRNSEIFKGLKIMPRKKRDIKVGALVKMHRRKEPGLGMVVERLTQDEMSKRDLHTWQHKEAPDEYACKVRWIKRPSAWEGIETKTSLCPESWLQIVGDVK